jgi:hypothetical protein
LFSNGAWSQIDLTVASAAPTVGVGSSLAAHMNTIATSEEVYFVAANQSVQEVWSSAKAAPTWYSSNLFGIASGTIVDADPGSPLTVAVDQVVSPNRDEIDYIGTDAAVHQLWWTGSTGWTSVTP